MSNIATIGMMAMESSVIATSNSTSE